MTWQALAARDLFERWGFEGRVYAAAIDPRLKERVQPLSRLRLEPDDLLVIRYSAYAKSMGPLLEHPQRKLLIYHNVTPARYLWSHSPLLATFCALGRQHLPRYARAATVAVADSHYNARELERAGARDPRVVPILLDGRRLEPKADPGLESSGPLVLSVGRLVPNKRHDLVIAAFALYQRHCAPEAQLLCVGEPVSPSYGDLLREVVRRTGARNVRLAGVLPQAQLNGAYARASVLISLSEHEGFCVPLLEAFHFGVPVVARPAGAKPEVGGDAVLWAPDDDLAVVAELLDLAVRDAPLRAELRRRGKARLGLFSYERTAAALREAVDAALESVI